MRTPQVTSIWKGPGAFAQMVRTQLRTLKGEDSAVNYGLRVRAGFGYVAPPLSPKKSCECTI